MRIVGWEEFQGYKKRGPEWIKLHLSLLDQPQYLALPVVARAVMPALWLTAARISENGTLPDDVGVLSTLSHVKESELSEALPYLCVAGFISCDKVVADSATRVSPQTEERESRGERENGQSGPSPKPAENTDGNGAYDREGIGRLVWLAFRQRFGIERDCASPAEWALLCRWLDAKIPLRVLERGISETGGTPRNLWACEKPVDRAVEYWQKATA